jgi:hypothetical protein
MPCFAANPRELSGFGIPAYVAGRLWCPYGAFSGVNQGRHSNHLHAVGLCGRSGDGCQAWCQAPDAIG